MSTKNETLLIECMIKHRMKVPKVLLETLQPEVLKVADMISPLLGDIDKSLITNMIAETLKDSINI